MQEERSREPLSTTHPLFLVALREALDRGGELFILVRLNRSAGARQAYHVRSAQDAETILKFAQPGDSVSVFFPPSSTVRGRAGESLLRAAISYFKSQEARKDLVAAIVLGQGAQAAAFDFVSTPDELSTWLETHPKRDIAVGIMDFTMPNCDQALTAYVPDPNGAVKPGAY